jgi:histidinol phosphatase-like enzyme (inositol monophosphatase family)
MINDSTADLIGLAEGLADESRRLLSNAASGAVRVETKADRSFVTDVDRAIEARLRELITDAQPAHGIVGEEYGGQDMDADVVWVLDPIDGTAHFIAGIPVYGTLIGISRTGEPWIGILDFPATGDRWIGVAGDFAVRNGVPVRTRPCRDLRSAIVTCSNPDFLQPDELAALARVRQHARYTMYGASSFAYGLLASGRTDLAVDAGLKPYDVFAPAAVLGGAGGLMTQWSGAAVSLSASGRFVAAGDPQLHRMALAVLR